MWTKRKRGPDPPAAPPPWPAGARPERSLALWGLLLHGEPTQDQPREDTSVSSFLSSGSCASPVPGVGTQQPFLAGSASTRRSWPQERAVTPAWRGESLAMCAEPPRGRALLCGGCAGPRTHIGDHLLANWNYPPWGAQSSSRTSWDSCSPGRPLPAAFLCVIRSIILRRQSLSLPSAIFSLFGTSSSRLNQTTTLIALQM